MAFNDLITNQFTALDWAGLDAALTAIETILKGKVVNLTPEERKQYGSVNETNKLFINKVKDYLISNPGLAPPVMNQAEFENDYTARTEIDTRLRRINIINEMLDDTQTAFDWDNYHAALTFYNYIKFQSHENVPGTNVVYADLHQFFNGGPKSAVSPKPEDSQP